VPGQLRLSSMREEALEEVYLPKHFFARHCKKACYTNELRMLGAAATHILRPQAKPAALCDAGFAVPSVVVPSAEQNRRLGAQSCDVGRRRGSRCWGDPGCV